MSGPVAYTVILTQYENGYLDVQVNNGDAEVDLSDIADALRDAADMVEGDDPDEATSGLVN